MSSTSSPAETASSRRWLALGLIAAAQFMVIMDTSIIGVALPKMQADLGFTAEGLSWVFNAYVVAFGGLLLLGGRLSDLFGARRIFSFGWGILTVGSLIAGLADGVVVELAGRAVQGVGSALIAPAALTLLFTIFGSTPKELTKALALYGAAAPAGGTAGVFLGVLPLTVTIMVGMIGVAPRLIARFGPKAMTVSGLATLAAGLVWLSFIRSDGSFVSDVLPASLVAAAGMAMAFIPSLGLVLSSAAPEEGGLASGIVSTNYQVGSALGLALMTAVASGFGADRPGDAVSQTQGFSAGLLGAAAIAAVGALLAQAWLRTPQPSPLEPAEEKSGAAA